jgi:hypothetical protein
MVIIIYLLYFLLADLAQAFVNFVLAAGNIADQFDHEPDRPAKYCEGDQNGYES